MYRDKLQSSSVISLSSMVLDSRAVSILNIKKSHKLFIQEMNNGVETQKDLNNEQVKDLIKHSPNLKVLELQNLNQELLLTISSFCPKLHSLYFHSYDPDLVHFLSQLTNQDNDFLKVSNSKRRKLSSDFLTHLKVLACPFNIQKNALELFVKSLKNLETLIIEYAPENAANHSIQGQFQPFYSKIKHLILGNLAIQDDTIFSSLPKHNLIELEMLYCISDYFLLKALQFFNLRKLSINACYCSFSGIRKISELKQLESLEIERLNFPNDTLEETFTSIFVQCSHLKQFRVTGVFKLYSHSLFETLATNLPHLTHLDLQPNMHKREINWRKILIKNALPNITRLKSLQLLGLPFSDIDDDNFKAILAACPKLTTIDFSKCENIKQTDYIIETVEANQNLQYIMYLARTSIKKIEKIPKNLKICICNEFDCVFLKPQPFYNLI